MKYLQGMLSFPQSLYKRYNLSSNYKRYNISTIVSLSYAYSRYMIPQSLSDNSSSFKSNFVLSLLGVTSLVTGSLVCEDENNLQSNPSSEDAKDIDNTSERTENKISHTFNSLRRLTRETLDTGNIPSPNTWENEHDEATYWTMLLIHIAGQIQLTTISMIMLRAKVIHLRSRVELFQKIWERANNKTDSTESLNKLSQWQRWSEALNQLDRNTQQLKEYVYLNGPIANARDISDDLPNYSDKTSSWNTFIKSHKSQLPNVSPNMVSTQLDALSAFRRLNMCIEILLPMEARTHRAMILASLARSQPRPPIMAIATKDLVNHILHVELPILVRTIIEASHQENDSAYNELVDIIRRISKVHTTFYYQEKSAHAIMAPIMHGVHRFASSNRRIIQQSKGSHKNQSEFNSATMIPGMPVGPQAAAGGSPILHEMFVPTKIMAQTICDSFIPKSIIQDIASIATAPKE